MLGLVGRRIIYISHVVDGKEDSEMTIRASNEHVVVFVFQGVAPDEAFRDVMADHRIIA